MGLYGAAAHQHQRALYDFKARVPFAGNGLSALSTATGHLTNGTAALLALSSEPGCIADGVHKKC